LSKPKVLPCKKEHLQEVASIFSKAFADSMAYFAPDNPKVGEALNDIFSLVWLSFKHSFFVIADENESVLGYIVVTDNIKRLWFDAIKSGFIFKLTGKWLTGRYGISFGQVLRIFYNKVCYLRFEYATGALGQILSLAVEPMQCKKGYGHALVWAGMEHLRKQGVKRVKLEVRPDNVSALKLYSSYGFVQVGRARDVQGEWLIMEYRF
jgi:ribosomal-protein-alanine N-acetyltransferase